MPEDRLLSITTRAPVLHSFGQIRYEALHNRVSGVRTLKSHNFFNQLFCVTAAGIILNTISTR
jgi:hypothetical protein